MFKMELDVHTHSLASGHYSDDTVTLMLKQAKKNGLKVLGISEHGPAMPGSCKPSYFMNIVTAPPIRMGIRTLYGAEANIVDHDGTLDLPDELLQKLDYGTPLPLMFIWLSHLYNHCQVFPILIP